MICQHFPAMAGALFQETNLSSVSFWCKKPFNHRNVQAEGLELQLGISHGRGNDQNGKCIRRVREKLFFEKISAESMHEMYSQNLRRQSRSDDLDVALELHLEMKKRGLQRGILLETVLVDKAFKAGRLKDALLLFEKMTDRNVVSWTSVVSGCVSNHRPVLGLKLFVEMLESGFLANDFTFNVVLRACADLASFDIGQQVHSLAIRSGLAHDSRIQNSLIHFYSKCGSVVSAKELLTRMPEPDLVSFTSMIAGYAKKGKLDSALQVFDEMRWSGISPNEHTVASILSSSGMKLGEQIHAYMIKAALDQSFYSVTSLIKLYSENHLVECAELVFRKSYCKNVVTWSLMISCYITNGLVNNALKLFCEMVYSGTEPNEFTFSTVIGGCGLSPESKSLGRQIHSLLIKLNFSSNHRVCNALLTMYARMNMVEELEIVFQRIQHPDTVSWSAVISGYSQNGHNEKSASLLCSMHKTGIKANEYGFSSALSSCADLALIDQGRQFHCLALKLGCDSDVCVGNALVNMYAKCGTIEDARLAFDDMLIHDVLSWNSLIHGYAHHGQAKEATVAFDEMLGKGCFMPNHATFVGVLNACSHVGNADEALGYFKSMNIRHGVSPSLSHYTCMIDLLARAGQLSEITQIISEMPYEPNSTIWKSVAGGCNVHQTLEFGTFAALRAIELSPEDSANYVLLSNLYTMCGQWEEAKRIRVAMDEKGLKKEPGSSWIEIKGEVHSFMAGDRSRSGIPEIYELLDNLLKEMKDESFSITPG